MTDIKEIRDRIYSARIHRTWRRRYYDSQLYWGRLYWLYGFHSVYLYHEDEYDIEFEVEDIENPKLRIVGKLIDFIQAKIDEQH